MALPKGYPVESHGSMAFFLLQMAIKISVLKKCRKQILPGSFQAFPRKLSAGWTPIFLGPEEKVAPAI